MTSDGKGARFAAANGPARDAIPRPAAWLGTAGLVPFFAGAAAVWLAPEGYSYAARAALIGYGAVILAFMGGCRWGFAAMTRDWTHRWSAYLSAVLPALYAWLATMAPWPWPGPLLAFGFAALLRADTALTLAGGAPPWWPRLRWPLTLGAVAALLSVAPA